MERSERPADKCSCSDLQQTKAPEAKLGAFVTCVRAEVS